MQTIVFQVALRMLASKIYIDGFADEDDLRRIMKSIEKALAVMAFVADADTDRLTPQEKELLAKIFPKEEKKWRLKKE